MIRVRVFGHGIWKYLCNRKLSSKRIVFLLVPLDFQVQLGLLRPDTNKVDGKSCGIGTMPAHFYLTPNPSFRVTSVLSGHMCEIANQSGMTLAVKDAFPIETW